MIPFIQLTPQSHRATEKTIATIKRSDVVTRPVFDVFMFLFLGLRALVPSWLKRLWFRLTTSIICAWCQTTTRRAWLPIAAPSHGICRDCFTRMQAGVNHDVFNAQPSTLNQKPSTL